MIPGVHLYTVIGTTTAHSKHPAKVAAHVGCCFCDRHNLASRRLPRPPTPSGSAKWLFFPHIFLRLSNLGAPSHLECCPTLLLCPDPTYKVQLGYCLFHGVFPDFPRGRLALLCSDLSKHVTCVSLTAFMALREVSLPPRCRL